MWWGVFCVAAPAVLTGGAERSYGDVGVLKM